MWCNEQLGRLQGLLAGEFPDDATVLAVSTDTHADSEKLVRGVKELYGLAIELPLLEDVDHAVIARYGLLNMNTAPGPSTRRYATPGTYIIDKGGTVRWRMVDDNWKLRPTGPVVMAALRKVAAGEDATSVTLESVYVEDTASVGPVELPVGSDAPEGMVLVPAGTFAMGQKGGRAGDAPAHEVELDAFWVDRHEVTNAQYRDFLKAMTSQSDHRLCHPGEPRGKDHTPRFWTDSRFNGDTLPVVGVDWYDAFAYAAWAGKRLPTEAQWEWLARGGVDGQDYPWGNEIDASYANIDEASGEAAAVLADQGRTRESPAPTGPKPVGSYAAGAFGVFDVIGNVEEWCLDWYDQAYYPRSPRRNPPGPISGVLKVVRGGSWHHAKGRAHTRYTHSLDEQAIFLGFRCVRPASAPDPSTR